MAKKIGKLLDKLERTHGLAVRGYQRYAGNPGGSVAADQGYKQFEKNEDAFAAALTELREELNLSAESADVKG